ncbi:transmembrane protein, putative [Medicago truncatula]|uniref:Transmembrane protein, putative n=1 Tax=Medicago truncatula TaxID=3880 RepID=A0A072TEW2_MEDTR|nr:transmembrane protein, putative [Medicago truncatula]
MTSKGVGLKILSLNLFMLVDTLIIMLWIYYKRDITNLEVVENLVYVGTNPQVHNDGDDGGDKEEERIFDGLSLGAKERGLGTDLVRKYEDWETKIYLPQVRNLAQPVLGLARPCHPPELLLLLLLRF